MKKEKSLSCFVWWSFSLFIRLPWRIILSYSFCTQCRFGSIRWWRFLMFSFCFRKNIIDWL